MTKIKGIDIDDVLRLERDIKRNFGSVRVFCSETKMPYRRLLKVFNQLEFTEDLFNRICRTFDSNMEGRTEGNIPCRITEDERSKIRLCILENFHSYTDFCKENEAYNVVYITNVTKGNLKLKSIKYKRLVRLMNKKYKLGVKLKSN